MNSGCKRALLGSVILAMVLFFSPGCSSDDSSGSVFVVPTCIEFLPAQTGTPANNSIVLRKNTDTSDCDEVQVEIVVTNVNDVYGAGFVIEYNGAIVAYQGFSTTGSFLEDNNVDTQIVQDGPVGSVTFSITRVQDANSNSENGVDVSGSRVLGTLRFRSFSVGGPVELTLTNNNLFDNQTPPQAIPNLTWEFGSLRVD